MKEVPKIDLGLTGYEELFTTQVQRDRREGETVVDLPLDEISDFPNHPFKVRQDRAIRSVMREEKPNQKEVLRVPKARIARFFPEGTSAQTIEDTVIEALELYRKRHREQER